MMHFLSKTYPCAYLLASLQEIAERCALITALTQATPAPVSFHWQGDCLVRETVRLPSVYRHVRLPLSHAQGWALAMQLELAYAQGLVHGDLHPKNLFYCHQQPTMLVISDWEPALQQIRQGRPTLMATPPYVHPDDNVSQKLSYKTDCLCFARLVLPKQGVQDYCALIQPFLAEATPFLALARRYLP